MEAIRSFMIGVMLVLAAIPASGRTLEDENYYLHKQL